MSGQFTVQKPRVIFFWPRFSFSRFSGLFPQTASEKTPITNFNEGLVDTKIQKNTISFGYLGEGGEGGKNMYSIFVNIDNSEDM